MNIALLNIPNRIFIKANMDRTECFTHLKHNSPDPEACIYFIHTKPLVNQGLRDERNVISIFSSLVCDAISP